MVIASGATEAFTLVFHSNEVKVFTSSVKYLINNKQPFQLGYRASVRNVSLKLSTNLIKFQFKNEKIHDKAEFTQYHRLKLSNLGNAPALFNWDEPAKKFFSINPMSGVVNPDEVGEVKVGFTALEGMWKGEIEDVLKCNLENGSAFMVNVSGVLNQSKCTIVGGDKGENVVNFDCIHVGVEESKDFIIKNDTKVIAAYSIVRIINL